jgi:feruloyl esterase
MKRSALLVPFALLIATPATVLAKDQAEFAIKSLNTPDPIFVTSGNSVPVSVTSTDAKALKKAVVRLNGLDVTSAFSIGADGALSGTPSGLVPGINTFEVFTSKGDKDSEARLRVARAKSPSFSCSLVSFSGASLPVANTVVTAASPVAATATVPSHCLVTGTIDAGRVGYPSSASAPQSTYTYTINWAVRLPDAWNNKFYYAGGGGLDGSVPNTANNTIGGYATASNDSGHNNTINNDPLAAGTGSFATDFEARTNFAYRAIDVTTQTAKSLIDRYYSDHPAFSYFQGCSMGGREAMMVTQKLPTYFDGSVIGDPGFKLVSMSTHEVYDAQVLASLAQSMGLVSSTGAPLAANTFTNQDLQLVSKAVLDACDALDGVVDGMVANFHQCTTSVVRPKVEALTCPGAKTPTCLTPGQVAAIEKIYAGPTTHFANGKPTYYPWMWDPGIAGCTSATDCNTPTATNIATGWRGWKIGQFQTNLATAVNNASDFTGGAGGALSSTLAPTPPVLPAPTASEGLFKLLISYNLDDYVARIRNTTAAFPVSSYDQLQVDSPDRRAFKRHGSKMIITQPQSGGPFSPLAMVDWYEKLNRFEGGDRNDFHETQTFARLFMQPGAQHCGGGPSTSSFNAFPYVVDWVENGNAPDSILSTAPAATPWPGRTRPLCPYPAYARYNGTGDVNAASSFTCHADPRPHRHGDHDGDGDHDD